MNNDLYGSDNVPISAALEPWIGLWKGELSGNKFKFTLVIEFSNREGAEGTFIKNTTPISSPFYYPTSVLCGTYNHLN